MLNINDIIVDAELEALLPALDEQENIELMISIERDGFTDPIIVWLGQGVLVDGHNRYRIWRDALCRDEDKAPEIKEKPFKDKEEVKDWMRQRALARRNLRDAMRVKIALERKPFLQAKAKANKVESGKASGRGKVPQLVVEPLEVTKEIAKSAGVSHETVRRVETVLDKATEGTKQAMLSGEKSIAAAFNETKKVKLEPPVAAEPPSPESSAPKQQNKPLGVGVERAHEAIACLKRIPAGDALRKRAFEIVSDWMKHNK